MTHLEVRTRIAAPPEVCFDLARDIDFHARSLAHTGERVTVRPERPLLGLGDEVEFVGRHFGVRQRLRARIVSFDRPRQFRDEMVRGAFRSFVHDHRFEPSAGGTLMRDRLRFAAPLWPLGVVVERVLLAPYLRQLIAARGREIKAEAERVAATARTADGGSPAGAPRLGTPPEVGGAARREPETGHRAPTTGPRALRCGMDAPPKGYLAATVDQRLDIVDDLAVFWLRPPEPLTFLPGQYVTLAVPNARGGIVKRAYSVVSAPHEPLVELVIEHVPDGELTPLLWPLRQGDTVWVRKKVVGHFLLDAERTRHLMACTVTGIAPFLSMIRAHAAAQAAGEPVPDHRFLVIHGASASVELGPYRAEMEALAAGGWVDAVPTVSRPWADPGWTGEVGRVEDVLRKHLDRLGWAPDEVAGYACGNPDMIETALGILRRARVDAAHLHEEKYFTVGEAGTPAEAAPMPKPALAPPPGKRPPGRGPGSVTLKTAPRAPAGDT